MVVEPELEEDKNADILLQAAISASLRTYQESDQKLARSTLLNFNYMEFCTFSDHDVAEILKTHSVIHVSASESCKVKLRRTHIWDDSMMIFHRVY